VPTPKADTLEPPLLGTKTQFPSEVIPPESGLTPVDAAAGDIGARAPVAELYWYCETWFDPLSTTNTKLKAGLTMNETGRVPAPTAEPACVKVPSALGQAAVTCTHAVKMLMLLDPVLATNR
jgi:hypothetical protein